MASSIIAIRREMGWPTKIEGTPVQRALHNLDSRVLERQLQRQLADTRITGAGYLADAACNIAVGILELNMIEGVEEFRTEFERDPLRDTGVLVKRKIPVVESWTMEEAALHLPGDAIDWHVAIALAVVQNAELRIEGSNRIVSPISFDLKEHVPGFTWIQKMDWPSGVVRHIRSTATAQRSIITFAEGDREARGEACDAGDGPATKQLARHTMTRFSERQVVFIAHDKVVRDVERGECAAQAWIVRIDRIKKPGRVVNRFRPAVCSADAKSSNILCELNLKRVVVGVRDRRLPCIVRKIERAESGGCIQ